MLKLTKRTWRIMLSKNKYFLTWGKHARICQTASNYTIIVNLLNSNLSYVAHWTTGNPVANCTRPLVTSISLLSIVFTSIVYKLYTFRIKQSASVYQVYTLHAYFRYLHTKIYSIYIIRHLVNIQTVSNSIDVFVVVIVGIVDVGKISTYNKDMFQICNIV